MALSKNTRSINITTENKDLFIDYDKFIDYLKIKGIYLGVTINPIMISKNEDIELIENNIDFILENIDNIDLFILKKICKTLVLCIILYKYS